MKRIFTYTKMLFVALIATAGLCSCDEDDMIAYDLNGIWQGNIASSYYTHRYGMVTDYYDTEIMFDQRGAWGSGGTGYEIDRDRYGRYTKVFFDWSVRNGKIYISFEDGAHVIIRDFETYRMSGIMRFRGYFDDYQTGEQIAEFSLMKIESPNDYYDRYYSRTRGSAGSSGTIFVPDSLSDAQPALK